MEDQKGRTGQESTIGMEVGKKVETLPRGSTASDAALTSSRKRQVCPEGERHHQIRNEEEGLQE